MAENIYAPPESELQAETNDQSNELAKRSSRFYAAVIDSLIGMVYGVPFMLLVGPSLGFELGQTQQPGTEYTVVAVIFGFIFFSLIHGYFLHINGQTIGKKVIGIKIVSTSHDNVSAAKILGQRYLPISLVSAIPVLGQILPLVDVLFIFRGDRRCIHDLIAGTCVIKCKS